MINYNGKKFRPVLNSENGEISVKEGHDIAHKLKDHLTDNISLVLDMF